MSTISEIKSALRTLSLDDRQVIAGWLEGYEAEELGFSGVREPALEYAAEPRYMTEEEYLAFVERSPTRHEYVNGYVHEMCAPTMPHGRVVSRLTVALAKRLGDGPCEAFAAGLQVQADTSSNHNYYFPDIMVYCDRVGWKEQWARTPRVIVEVLSPSTQHIDRREKATSYRKVPGMEEYVIAAQGSAQFTIFRRAEGWVAEVVTGLDAAAEFRSLGVSIPLVEIYRGLPPEAASAESVGPE